MAWQKGQSGNPGGRKRQDDKVVELARDASPRAIGRLIELMESDQPRAAIAACNSILERAYGKPVQPIAGSDEHPPLQIETPSVDALAKLSADDRAAIRDILGRALS